MNKPKYDAGQRVLIPAVIESVSEKDGVMLYRVDANIWDGIREEEIVKDNRSYSYDFKAVFGEMASRL